MPKPVPMQPKRYLGFKKKSLIWECGKNVTIAKNIELCLNYNSENNSSLWADMMEKDLEWNKQQNLDDENQEATQNIEFKKKAKRPAAMVHYFWNITRAEMGIDERSNLFKN